MDIDQGSGPKCFGRMSSWIAVTDVVCPSLMTASAIQSIACAMSGEAQTEHPRRLMEPEKLLESARIASLETEVPLRLDDRFLEAPGRCVDFDRFPGMSAVLAGVFALVVETPAA